VHLKLCVRYSCPRSDCADEEDAKFDDDEFDAGAKRGALATGDGDAQRFIRSSARTMSRVHLVRAVRETRMSTRGIRGDDLRMTGR
jgi:hypothetical protein